MEILSKNTNFRQKIQILMKNQNFDEKSKFWSKTQILIKNVYNFQLCALRHPSSNIWAIRISEMRVPDTPF